jgi:hypothetical protein
MKRTLLAALAGAGAAVCLLLAAKALAFDPYQPTSDTNPLPVTIPAAGTAEAPITAADAGATVTCAAATTALIPAGAAGRYVTLSNTGTVDAWLGPSGGAAATGTKLKAGGDLTLGPLAAAFALDCLRVTTDATVNRQVWSH